MIGLFLLLMIEGIALSQAVSSPREVTLPWLRLGGLISLALLAVAWTVEVMTRPGDPRLFMPLLIAASAAVVAQLMSTQLGWRNPQRLSAAVATLAAGGAAAEFLARTLSPDAPASPQLWLVGGATVALAGGLVGGFLMTMLLGHAYLTAGSEMTQRPFTRLVVMLAVLLVLRLAASLGLAFFPWWRTADNVGGFVHVWTTMMITGRYLVGLIVPGVFTWMIYDCVRRRANQSATGILYVAGILVVIGEGVALALIASTGLAF